MSASANESILPVIDIETLRAEFPILHQNRARPAAGVSRQRGESTQKPRAVIDAISHYYEHDNANVHRGVHCR